MENKDHKHCPVCNGVMKEVGEFPNFHLFYCDKYPCRAIRVDFSADSKGIVNKVIVLRNEKDIDERPTKERIKED